MAIILVSFDLQRPGKSLWPVEEYLRKFASCKYLESVWLLDTTISIEQIRAELTALTHDNDTIFVIRIQRDWGNKNSSCSEWLNHALRNW